MPDFGRQPEDAHLSAAAAAQAQSAFLAESRPRNVVGYGYGAKWRDGRPTGEAAVLVFVTLKTPTALLAPADVVPPALDDGTLTDVVAVGHLVAQQTNRSLSLIAAVAEALGAEGQAVMTRADSVGPVAPQFGPPVLARRMRPCPAGLSIGNVAITAGTLGGVVYDFLPGATTDPPAAGAGVPSTFYLLSNNHVLAASNAAALGSPIVQPGRSDGGTDPADRIGVLSRFVPLEFSPQVPLERQNNVVDCAIAACQFQDATREVYFNGPPRG